MTIFFFCKKTCFFYFGGNNWWSTQKVERTVRGKSLTSVPLERMRQSANDGACARVASTRKMFARADWVLTWRLMKCKWSHDGWVDWRNFYLQHTRPNQTVYTNVVFSNNLFVSPRKKNGMKWELRWRFQLVAAEITSNENFGSFSFPHAHEPRCCAARLILYFSFFDSLSTSVDIKVKRNNVDVSNYRKSWNAYRPTTPVAANKPGVSY